MCCSPNREAVRAATHYHMRAWQTLIYGKECYMVIVIYPPFQHKCLRYNHRTMFHNLRLRAFHAAIPLQHGNDVLAMLQWYCSTASRNQNNQSTMFLNLWPRACHAVIRFTDCNMRLRHCRVAIVLQHWVTKMNSKWCLLQHL